MPDKKFKVVIPAQLEKGKNGEWRLHGLASTNNRDAQGEIVNIKGLDLTPIQKGKGVFSFDHQKGPENTIGAIDVYDKTKDRLYLGGYLFQNHDRAKAVYQIMSSLKKADRGRVGMSVEGVIKERTGEESKTINKAVISSCALTFNPINTDTYCDLVKSFSDIELTKDLSIKEDFDNVENSKGSLESSNTVFTPAEVVKLVQKALSIGSEKAEVPPADLKDGAALGKEDLNSKKKRKSPKKLKKLTSVMYKSYFIEIIEHLRKLYPNATTSELFETVKERLNTRFKDLNI